MTELFYRAGLHVGIAHCNFQLRGKDSLDDEEFVHRLAAKINTPFFVKRFSTAEFAKREGVSIQMAARKLRYEWFEEIRSTENFDFIATAHHRDDQVETFFINLIRGTGISGLHGILPKKDKIIRPMLFTNRHEIEDFAINHFIPWREDRSNEETKYLRNRIRLELLPIMKSLNPDLSAGITATIVQIRSLEEHWKNEISRTKQRIVSKTGEEIRIDLRKLTRLKPLQPLIWELLSPYGFNDTVIRDLLESSPGESGKMFFSKAFRLIKNRDELIITPLSDSTTANVIKPGRLHVVKEPLTIEEGVNMLKKPLPLSFTIMDIDNNFEIPLSSNIANLNLAKIEFPLTLRKWHQGDAFCPLGMNKKKKLSDFFINMKFSIPEKENCWLLCSGKHIIWIVGYRIDHRFRITRGTKKILQIELKK